MVLWPGIASTAIAADQRIEYALEIGGDNAIGGIKNCAQGARCKAESLGISLTFNRLPKDIVLLSASSRNIGCCYFAYGEDTARLDPKQPYHRLPLYEGGRRLGNEFVINKRIGLLYVKFTSSTQ
ncbi:MAG: hypothetical protein ACOY4O_00825 [Pseudomonadota bacterium]